MDNSFWECGQCSYSFRTIQELHDHIEKYHHGIPVITKEKCPKCNREIRYFGEIVNENWIIYHCQDCGKLYKMKNK